LHLGECFHLHLFVIGSVWHTEVKTLHREK
jgi:hypothetical protein